VWQYHLPDALGSVRQIADPMGQVRQSRRYDPFGGLQMATSPAGSAYGFAGEEQDPTTGQLYLRARTYNPATGRFLQTDPVLGTPDQPRTLHNYAYSFNNPVNYVDPSGQMPPWGGSYKARSQRSSPSRAYTATEFRSPSPSAAGFRQGRMYRQATINTPATSYSRPAPTQWMTAYNLNASSYGSSSRSANGLLRGAVYRDPHAREQSQGHRPEGCGPTNVAKPGPLDWAFGIRDKGREMIDNVEGFAEDPEGHLLDWGEKGWGYLKQNWQKVKNPQTWIDLGNRIKNYDYKGDWENFTGNFKEDYGLALSVTLSMLPVVGFFYDAYTLCLGYDPITGQPLTDFERGLVFAGMLGSLVGAGFINEAASQHLIDVLKSQPGNINDLPGTPKPGRNTDYWIGHYGAAWVIACVEEE
jgi:RHS repeat-associated protein